MRLVLPSPYRSGIGRELGEYALDNYIEVKTVITKMDDRTRY
jgi:acyl-CoA reductase-like NAD-dependent aldehyde dehydrogenase